MKNSSLVEAVKNLPAYVEVVAFVDADAITYPQWLRDLITPLIDSEIGCSTGIRWFAPIETSFGARLRCYWNTVALISFATGVKTAVLCSIGL